MQKIRTIIIEDEIGSQELLTSIITNYCPQLEFVGVAGNLQNACILIKETLPDLVFLDIHIGKNTGFDLLDEVAEHDFKIIITTAHEEYAFKAFKYQALDYLLKPYTPTDVITAVQRIVDSMEDNKAFLKLEQIIKSSLAQSSTGKITVPTTEGYKVFRLDTVVRIEANGAYSKVVVEGSRPVLVSKNLKEMEELLPEGQFYRTHDSHIINFGHVREYKKEDGGAIILENNDEVPVSRRKKQEFLELLMAR